LEHDISPIIGLPITYAETRATARKPVFSLKEIKIFLFKIKENINIGGLCHVRQVSKQIRITAK
jgi:hypothetical protein